MFGIERCMRYFTAIIKTVVSWFRNRCGLKGENERLQEQKDEVAKRALRWVAQVEAYRTEEGIRMIRTCKKDYDAVIALFNESLEFVKAAYEDKLPRLLAINVLRLENEARRLFNIATRTKRFGKTRFTPFHIQFYGTPGVGKSVIIQNLIDHIHKMYYTNRHREGMTYNRGNNDHWDGYTGQPIIVKDEAYPAKIAEKLVEDLAIVSCNPFLTPQADLHDKGAIYLESDWYLTNTNVAYPNCAEVYDMTAIHRRRHLLVEVKCDTRVLDPATHKFDIGLFQAYYPGESSRDFPHLKFSILKSVHPSSVTGGSREVAEASLGEACHYSNDEELPSGLKRPLDEISWEVLLALIHTRRTAMRNEERLAFEGGSRSRNILLNYLEIQNMTYDLKASNPSVRVPTIFDLNNLEYEDAQIESEAASFKNLTTEDLDEIYNDFLKGVKKNPVTDEHEPTSDEDNMTYQEVIALEDSWKSLEPEELQRFKLSLSRLCNELIYGGKSSRRYYKRVLKIWLDVNQDTLQAIQIAQDKVEKAAQAPVVTPPVENIKEKENIPRRGVPLTLDEEIARAAAILEKRKHHRANDLRDGRFAGPSTPNEYVCSTKKTDQIPDKWDVPGVNLRGPYFGMRTMGSGQYSIHPGMVPMYEARTRPFMFAGWNEDLQGPSWQSIQFFYQKGSVLHLTRRLRETNFGQKFSRFGGKLPLCMMFCAMIEKTEREGEILWHLKVKNNKRLPSIWRDFNEIAISRAAGRLVTEETVEKSVILTMPGMLDSIKFFMDDMNEADREEIYAYVSQYSLIRLQVAQFSIVVEDKVEEGLQHLKDLVYRTSSWFWEKFKKWGKVLLTTVCAGGLIYLMRSFAQFILPHEATSKKFFRTPGARKITTKYTSGTEYLEAFDRYRARCLTSCRIRDYDIDGPGHVVQGIRCGHYLITVAHPFYALGAEYYHITMCPTLRNPMEWEAVFSKNSVYLVPNTDIAFVYLRDFAPAPDCSKLFWSEEESNRVELPNYIELMRYKDTNLCLEVTSMPVQKYTNFSFDMNGTTMDINARFIKVDWKSPLGYSGSPVFAHLPQTNGKILGVQSNTHGGSSYIAVITREMIAMVREEFDEMEHRGPIPTTYTSEVPSVSTLLDTHVEVVGRIKAPLVLGYTKGTSFRETPLAPYFGSQSLPAILHGLDPRVPKGTHPCAHSANKSGRGSIKPLDPRILKQAVEGMSGYYGSRLDYDKLYVLDKVTDVIRGVNDTEPINTKTSPGIPYVWNRPAGFPGKKFHLRYSEDGTIEYCSEKFLEDLAKMDVAFRSGVIPEAQMYEFPKDELRPAEKVLGYDGQPQRTRTISVFPMTVNALYRKYFLAFDAQVHKWADGTFPCCVGMNPEGPAFTNAYYRLMAGSPIGLCADIQNWDGYWCPQLAYAYLEMVQNCYDNAHFHECSDCDPLDDKICDKIVEDARARVALFEFNLYGNFQFYDAMCQKQRGMSSGFAGTADVNTGSHLLLLYYIYLKALKKYPTYWPFDEFLRMVPSLVYGDDIVFTISKEIISIFNYEYYVRTMRELGWGLTSADKNPNIKPMFVDRCTFLKRSFRMDYQLGIVFGALSLDTISDMLHWNRASTEPRSQLYTNIQLALEYLFAHGQTIYDEWRDRLVNALKKERLPIYCPIYSEIRARMISRYYGIPQQITDCPGMESLDVEEVSE